MPRISPTLQYKDLPDRNSDGGPFHPLSNFEMFVPADKKQQTTKKELRLTCTQDRWQVVDMGRLQHGRPHQLAALSTAVKNKNKNI